MIFVVAELKLWLLPAARVVLMWSPSTNLSHVTVVIGYSIFGEGSHISTNQKLEYGAFLLLIGINMRPFPEKYRTLFLNFLTLKTPVICLLIIPVIRLTVVRYSSIVSYTYVQQMMLEHRKYKLSTPIYGPDVFKVVQH